MKIVDSDASKQSYQGFSDKQSAIICAVGQHLTNLLQIDGKFCSKTDNADGSVIYFYRFENETEQCRSDVFVNLTAEGFIASVMAVAGVLGAIKEDGNAVADAAYFLVYLGIRSEESPLHEYIFKEMRSVCFDVMPEGKVNEILEKIHASMGIESQSMH